MDFSIRSLCTPTNLKRLKNLSTRDMFPGGFFYLSILILFVSFGFILLSAPVWDYDFWWHIATGRYIVETKSIPATDPFSFTSQLSENTNLYPLREKFILTQYWLAQIVLYLLYNYFGPAGIGVMRSVLLLGTLFVIYRALRSRGTAPYIAYLSLFLAFLAFSRATGERPVLFTILFSVMSFVMIDNYALRRSKTFYFLPALMLLWSNLHGGFILGDAIILVFMGGEAVRLLLGRSGFSGKERIVFFSVLLVAIGASAINPNGFFAFEIALSSKYAPFYAGIDEYRSPFYLFSMKVSGPDYGYIVTLSLLPVILFLRKKKFNPIHLVLLVLLAAQSISAGRFIIYYSTIASLVLGHELDLWFKEHHEKFVLGQTSLNKAFSVIMLASSLLYFAGMANTKILNIRESNWTVPKEAADFIEKNNLNGNMLNDMGTGGYLAWRLYPKVKTFIDSRSLNYTVMQEYSWFATTRESIYHETLPPGKIPLWKRLLEHYNINMVVFNPLDIYGNVVQLPLKLLGEEDWAPVFADAKTIIFVREIPENKEVINKFRKTDEEVLNSVVIRTVLYALKNTVNPLPMEAIGDVFRKMGKTDDAIKAYNYALKRQPDELRIKEKLDILMKEKSEESNE